MRRLSPTELRLKIKEMTDEHNLLDHAIGYFSQYGEPTDFSGIREVARYSPVTHDFTKFIT